jgi:hypothetical protein
VTALSDIFGRQFVGWHAMGASVSADTLVRDVFGSCAA